MFLLADCVSDAGEVWIDFVEGHEINSEYAPDYSKGDCAGDGCKKVPRPKSWITVAAVSFMEIGLVEFNLELLLYC